MTSTDKSKFENFREYQIDILNKAIKENTIVFLPTGAGKTFIAAELIRHCSKGIQGKFSDGFKRTFFLVNTVALVTQQADAISGRLPLEVGKYSGDMGVDFWDDEKWINELDSHEILVMTSQILLNLLLHGLITLKKINLLILDECHHATGNHPMNRIMKLYEPGPDAPKVLGLTATLLNANCQINKVVLEIRALEKSLHSKVVTSQDTAVSKHSANPSEIVIAYEPSSINTSIVDNCISKLLNVLSVTQLCETNDFQLPSDFGLGTPLGNTKSPEKKLMNILNEISLQANELGLLAASKAALSKIVVLERIKLANIRLPEFCLVINVLITRLHRLRHELHSLMSDVPLSQQPFKYSSSHMLELFAALKKYSRDSDSLTLVFVEKRNTAKILSYILKDMASVNPDFSCIKADFIVGNESNIFKDSREAELIKKNNDEVLSRFNKKEINVLFASDVVEEGIDISGCNLVIKFDTPKTVRSFIQARGRARKKGSLFLFMVPSERKDIYQHFKTISSEIGKAADNVWDEADNILQGADDDDDSIIEPYIVPSTGARVMASSAVSLLNRYCSTLPHDKFTRPTILWWIKTGDNKGLSPRVCASCLLPVNCPFKSIITGDFQRNQERAKKSLALKVCKMLHEAGELNDSLLPVVSSELLSDATLFPHWDEEEASSGKKQLRLYTKQFPIWMCSCKPLKGYTYIHLIEMTPDYKYPSLFREQFFYKAYTSEMNFAILSSNEWPSICQFPVYSNDGQLNINIKVNYAKVPITNTQFESLKKFHIFLFCEVLGLASNLALWDNENMENSFLIAPVLSTKKGAQIDWKTVENLNLPEVRPLKEEEIPNKFSASKYLGKIIQPWYRPSGMISPKYVVTRVREDMTPLTAFPKEEFQSYSHYYKDRYGYIVRNEKHPLLETRKIPKTTNSFILPRGKGKTSRKRKGKELESEFDEFLIPEMVTLFDDFPANYLIKGTYLATVIHRVYYLLLAEELRRKIACGTRVGIEDLPPDFVWKPLTSEKTLPVPEPTTANSTVPISDLLTNNFKTLVRADYPILNDDPEPLDLERNLNAVDHLSILYYEKFISDLAPIVELVKRESPYKIKKVCKGLSLPFMNVSDSFGPQQSEMCHVLISTTGNDIVNYERLETLGDSFLKFAVSLILYKNFSSLDEGKLTQIKGKLIGNRNLYFCGRKLNLGSMIKIQEFAAATFAIPCLGLDRVLLDLLEAGMPLQAVYQTFIEVSKDERLNGNLSPENLDMLLTKALETSEVSEEVSNGDLSLLNKQKVRDKCVADVVEAILGLYLTSTGLKSTFKVASWLGIFPDKFMNCAYEREEPSPLLIDNADPNDYLIQPDFLENALGYQFKNRAYLLQAMTHSSYVPAVTDCYQRFEFLGDAILDFLITSHIYYNCGQLNPGQLTDLRSALVNNVTFACIAVRYGFHKFLLSKSYQLTELINKFATQQENRNHEIGSEVLLLLDEDDTQVGELVEVPKALGDITESLAAAVYLDSGKCLKTTWGVFYELLKDGIDKFSKDVPINCIRMAYEKFPGGVKFENRSDKLSPDLKNSYSYVRLHISYNGQDKIFEGLGKNKGSAKLAAAKLALRYFHSPKVHCPSSL